MLKGICAVLPCNGKGSVHCSGELVSRPWSGVEVNPLWMRMPSRRKLSVTKSRQSFSETKFHSVGGWQDRETFHGSLGHLCANNSDVIGSHGRSLAHRRSRVTIVPVSLQESNLQNGVWHSGCQEVGSGQLFPEFHGAVSVYDGAARRGRVQVASERAFNGVKFVSE